MQISDTVKFGLQNKHANNCLICGANLPDDYDFQSYHMEKEHGLIT